MSFNICARMQHRQTDNAPLVLTDVELKTSLKPIALYNWIQT